MSSESSARREIKLRYVKTRIALRADGKSRLKGKYQTVERSLPTDAVRGSSGIEGNAIRSPNVQKSQT